MGEVRESSYAPFDVSDYLDSEEVIAELLTAAMEASEPGILLAVLAAVAKARCLGGGP
ncbi:hypothetical protein [Cupriavidus sp. IDO]|uniref:hypothetical protein n=1 Tax=Cupriavidus sp. IDO TaxID=1539142 RepID=UPI000B257E51|nr:hypothetical protein [Cupriavidus sp. IDO]